MTDLQEINSSDITVSTHKVFYKPKPDTLMLLTHIYLIILHRPGIDPFRFIHFNLSSMTFKKEKYKIVRSAVSKDVVNFVKIILY